MKPIHITDHAYDRAKERLGWKPKSLDRIVDRIYKHGVNHTSTSGKLREFIYTRFEEKNGVDRIKVYGENIFLFHGKRLITLYRLPNELTKYVTNNK